jgi:hypothetical protein
MTTLEATRLYVRPDRNLAMARVRAPSRRHCSGLTGRAPIKAARGVAHWELVGDIS